MFNTVLRSSTALLLCSVLSSPALAWNDGGHMMVAKIAYDKISTENPMAKIEIDRLLALQIAPARSTDNSSDFVSAAHWADDIKHAPGFTQTADEHFIDYPYSNDGTPLPTRLPKSVNIVTALTKYVGILQSPFSSDSDKATALRFVIHLVGDIHQPLHCVSRVSASYPHGDLGGNKVLIGQPLNELPSEITLHSFWDGGLGSFPHKAGHVAPPLYQVTQAAAAISAKFTADAQWKNGGPYDYSGWSRESQQIATSFVYQGLVDGQVPGKNYVTQGTLIAQQQLVKAGYRLALLLEAIWPKNIRRWVEKP